jgi:glycine/D-amino acid oxidase-like deaminating enzyme
LFVGNLGVNLPQLTVLSTVARTAPAPDFFQGGAAGGGIAFRRRVDGGYTLASTGTNEHVVGADSFRHFFKFLPTVRKTPSQLRLHFGGDLLRRLLPTRRWDADAVTQFEHTRVLNPPPSPLAVRQMHERVARRLPSLANIPFEETWAGMIDVMPDVVPVMDEVSDYPGLFIATGFSGHGFGIGPGAGRVMADLVSGRTPAHDLTRFRLSRFTDGTPMRPGPGL